MSIRDDLYYEMWKTERDQREEFFQDDDKELWEPIYAKHSGSEQTLYFEAGKPGEIYSTIKAKGDGSQTEEDITTLTDGLAERKNDGKPQYSLLELKYLEPCVKVLEFGAQKYSRGGYKKGFKVSSVIDSLLRHIIDLQQGKTLDEESGLPIIGHIQCNALFLGNLENNIDDLSIGETQ